MTSDTKPDNIKDKENVKKKDERVKEKEIPLSKVVLRRLPPTMTAETLLEQLSPVPDYDNFYFCPADKSLGYSAFSRAYINFINQEDLFVFTEKFDNYVFLDDKGGEFPVMVEYAPYQKIPKKRPKKNDTRKGTLEKDPDYLKFLESYQNPQKPQMVVTPEMILEEIETREKQMKANHGVLKVSTPLLDFVKRKREEKKNVRDKYRDDRKKREDERRKKKDDDRKRKRDRDRDRQMEKERDRKREKERHRDREQEREGKTDGLKMLIKHNEEKAKGRRFSEDGGFEKKYDNKDVRQRSTGSGKDTRGKEKPEKDAERLDRDRRRREKEDEEERKWRERERERREKREKERKDREKKERDRRDRDRERKDKERKQREMQKEQKTGDDQAVKSESISKVDIRSIIKVDVMKDSTSSLDDQHSGPDNPDRSSRDGDSRGQRSKARYKDRPERQMYNPGQRAAERRKQMEAKKEGTPEPREEGQGHRGQGRRDKGQGRRGDRGEGHDDYKDSKDCKGERKSSRGQGSSQRGGSGGEGNES